MIKKVLLTIFLSCLFILNVNAETGYVTDKTGVNMRDKASTKNSNVIVEIPYNTEFYISNTNAASGNGCSNAWYLVYYNGQNGYVCSNLVAILGETKTSYNRPWTSPKKAIVGGAEFISKSYIAKGQFTSYLKKFNINPNGYYSLYNNQYMANLRAPASESATTYNSLSKNGQLTSTYKFSIPVYTNMPSQTYSYNGLYAVDRPKSDTLADETFETSINGFPEDYKPYLRYIHSLHSNWTFTPMITNLDFNTVVSQENNVSSIETGSGYCASNPPEITESGWCIATTDATAFFIDPRNFLTEKYVFMFNDLSFDANQNEKIIQTVLDGTFMKGLSTIDNQTYASIFYEAGKLNSISSLYLASLAKQESGVDGGLTTDGREFEYEGYTYSGLYNFFNIGASSSESNPAKAGLVYANGGRGVNNGASPATTTTNPTTPVQVNFLSLLQVGQSGSYIKGYNIGTTVGSIKNTVGSSASVTIKNSSGTVLGDTSPIGTGYTISISSGSQNANYTYVLYGDLNGDGEINSADLLKMRQHLLGTNILTGSYLQSAYTSGDSEVNSADLLKIRQYLLGTTTIYQ